MAAQLGPVPPVNEQSQLKQNQSIQALFTAVNGLITSGVTVGTTPITSGTTLRVLYDNGGVVGEYTNVQVTALINPFTNVLSGAAPASGGGLVNFLRADGNWAIPSTSGAATIILGSSTITGGTNLRVLYDNAGTVGEYTNVQLTALIQPFSATLSGAVPLSGGGTVNFLRADGTWHVPSSGATLINTTVSITTTTTVSNGSKGATIVLSGTGATAVVNTLIFAAASGYDPDFQVRVLNADSRGWSIAPNAFTPFFLWPGQSKVIFNQGNVWNWDPYFERWSPNSASFTINVHPTSGFDTNDGLGTGLGAKQSVLNAWDMILRVTEGPAIIQMLPGGAFSPLGELDGDRSASFGRLIAINGDATLVNPPVITVPGGGIGVKFRDGGWASLNGLSFVASGNAAAGIVVEQGALADQANIKWGNFSTQGIHLYIADGGIANIQGAEIITGPAGTHWRVDTGGKLVVGSVTINGGLLSLNFTNGFILGDQMGRISINVGANYSQCGNFTGGGYTLTNISLLDRGGLPPPGGAGSADATSVVI